jgi:hypothetical protein
MIKRRSAIHLTKKDVGIRAGAAFLLVFLTFNPTGFSYFHKASAATWSPRPWGVVLIGLLLVAAWAFLGVTAKRVLGPWGVGITVLIFGAIVGFLYQRGWISTSAKAGAWISMIVIWAFFTIALTFNFFKRTLTGAVPTSGGEHDEHGEM